MASDRSGVWLDTTKTSCRRGDTPTRRTRAALMGTIYETSEQRCPLCRALLNRLGETNVGRGPRPGDNTVCAYCFAVLRVTDGALRVLTPHEHETLTPAERLDIARVQFMLAQVRANQN
jgi:hypothetical protein